MAVSTLLVRFRFIAEVAEIFFVQVLSIMVKNYRKNHIDGWVWEQRVLRSKI